MRRNDTRVVGDSAEKEAVRLLEERGFHVQNLNSIQNNHPTYDLLATKDGHAFKISVKCARAKRDLSLGIPSSVNRLAPGTFMFAFLPLRRDGEIAVAAGEYEFWIVPAEAVLADAMSAHYSYWGEDAAKASKNAVRVKDKVDRPGGKSQAGAVFARWSAAYRDAWQLLDV